VIEVTEPVIEQVVAPAVEQVVAPAVEQVTEQVVEVPNPVVEAVVAIAVEVPGLVGAGPTPVAGSAAPLAATAAPIVPVVDAVTPPVAVLTPLPQSMSTVLTSVPAVVPALAVPPLPASPAGNAAEPSPFTASATGSPGVPTVERRIGHSDRVTRPSSVESLSGLSAATSMVAARVAGAAPMEPLPVVPAPAVPSSSVTSSGTGGHTAPKAVLSAAVPTTEVGRIPLDVTRSDSVGGTSCDPGCSPD
jgi:hypothetical protein